MASATTFDASNQKLVHITKEVKTLGYDVHHLFFYARPEPTQLYNIESKIAHLDDQFTKLKLEVKVLGGSDLGQMMLDLIEEQEEKLVEEISSFESVRAGRKELCTADWHVSRLVEKFSSIRLAVKELDDNSTSNATEPQPLIQILEDRQKEARTELQRLVDKLSLTVHSTLFNDFDRAILNLWDISHAIDKKLSKLTGKPIVQPPPPANNLSMFQPHHSLIDLANLRRDILKVVDEKQLAKTILLYVGALESHAQLSLLREADNKKCNEHFQARIELGNFRKYLERYQEHLDQDRGQLLSLGQWFEDVVQKGEKDGHQVHHLKRDLDTWSSLATEPARDDTTDAISHLARIGAFHPPGQSISEALDEDMVGSSRSGAAVSRREAAAQFGCQIL